MQSRQRSRLSRVEPLEDRLALSALSPSTVVYNPPPPGTPPVYVAPSADYLPIELPPGVPVPAGMVSLPVPTGSVGLAQIGEVLAVGAATSFAAGHPDVQVQVNDFTFAGGRFLLVMTMTDGASYANYIVSEGTDGSVNVSFGENDLATGLSEAIVANQVDVSNASLFMTQSKHGALQSLTFFSEIGGNNTIFVYTPPAT